ncbi:unnamed protein product, partial [Amoebophrya sp. A25]
VDVCSSTTSASGSSASSTTTSTSSSTTSEDQRTTVPPQRSLQQFANTRVRLEEQLQEQREGGPHDEEERGWTSKQQSQDPACSTATALSPSIGGNSRTGLPQQLSKPIANEGEAVQPGKDIAGCPIGSRRPSLPVEWSAISPSPSEEPPDCGRTSPTLIAGVDIVNEQLHQERIRSRGDGGDPGRGEETPQRLSVSNITTNLNKYEYRTEAEAIENLRDRGLVDPQVLPHVASSTRNSFPEQEKSSSDLSPCDAQVDERNEKVTPSSEGEVTSSIPRSGAVNSEQEQDKSAKSFASSSPSKKEVQKHDDGRTSAKLDQHESRTACLRVFFARLFLGILAAPVLFRSMQVAFSAVVDTVFEDEIL